MKEPAKNGNSGAGTLIANEMKEGTMKLLMSPLLHRPWSEQESSVLHGMKS